VDLNDLLKDSAGYFRHLAQEKGIALNYQLPKGGINIFIDAARINQVISNLINNAIKFTEQNGKIKIEAKILENKVRVSVIDTGIGIAKQDIPKLFNKFVQLPQVAGMEDKGIGLGLSITKELIEAHGGEVWVDSKLGLGSKFYFTLPLFYKIRVVNRKIKKRINNLLAKFMSVYLINILIVNYEEFSERVSIENKNLIKALRLIIENSFKELYPLHEEKLHIVLTDSQRGEYNIIFPETEKKKADSFIKSLRSHIHDHLLKNKTKEVFINLGVMVFPVGVKPSPPRHFFANLHIIKINIGSEKRRFKRITYNADIEIVSPKDKGGAAQTLDVSKGGLCFVSERALETDAEVNIRLVLRKRTRPIHATARVAWVKKVERLPGDTDYKYKVGLEFLGLKDKDKKIISKELRL
jgi:hypothetical protein